MISRGILKDISFNQGDADLTRYPFSLPFIKDLNKLKIDAEVTFFVGSNGTGKSTLLEAIAVASGFNPEGGSINLILIPGFRIRPCINTSEPRAEQSGIRMAFS
jgi:predicted ATPase